MMSLELVGRALVRDGLPQRPVGVARGSAARAPPSARGRRTRRTRRRSWPARTCRAPPTWAQSSLGDPGVAAPVDLVRCSSSSCSGLGQVTSSSSSMRSSYSMPSAFISPTASPRALCSCAPEHLAAGPPGSPRPRTRRRGGTRSLRVEELEDTERVRRQRLVQREAELQVDVSRTVRPSRRAGRPAPRHRRRAASGSSRPHAGPAAPARLRPRGCRAAAGSIARDGLPSRAITLSSIACVTRNRDTSASGSAATSRSNVSSVQVTEALGRLLALHLRCFFGSSPAFASAFWFSTTCSGACTTTVPAVS